MNVMKSQASALPPIDPISIKTVRKYGSVTWIDIENPDQDSMDELANTYHFHGVEIAQCLQRGQITQIEVENEYIFLLFYSPCQRSGENHLTTSQINVFLGKDYLISLHEPLNIGVVGLIDKTSEKHPSEVKTAGRILYHLLDNLLEDTTEVVRTVSAELDDIEDDVFDSRASDAFRIGQIRKKIMRLRRTLADQKEMLEELDNNIDRFTGERLGKYYAANTKVSRKLWETVEEARETIEIYKDADFTTNTEKTNDILSILTLLFTLTIPATVLGTFYGMNILLPGGIETGSWTFLGSYTMLKLVSAISVVLALLMYLYFRKKRWF